MSTGPFNHEETVEWMNRPNQFIKDKAWKNSTNDSSANKWSHSLLGCLTPPKLCCLSLCVPCVPFGRTQHRLRHNGDMATYNVCNSSCCLFCITRCFGVEWIMQTMQYQDIRETHNLKGSFATDCLKSFYCRCCSSMQAEKETKARSGVSSGGVVSQQYQGGEAMEMGNMSSANKPRDNQAPGRDRRTGADQMPSQAPAA
ncbi:unnamed protein product [Periconia digitata]|uniref:Uncharacterized protein n=1 Tax=Periconia digitata TaxID=1303443 RepID=A0A9W4XRR3_9PLEO|nr:unnamed protein product [Periconia digitata]